MYLAPSYLPSSYHCRLLLGRGHEAGLHPQAAASVPTALCSASLPALASSPLHSTEPQTPARKSLWHF